MKKTSLLLAGAISAIISGAAVADNTLYGHIRLRMHNTDEMRMDSGKLVVGFKGENDLGNGLTSLYKLELEHDNADREETGWSNDFSYVGLKGDFGTFLMGNFSDLAGWACGATDIFQVNSGRACSAGAVNGRLGDSMAYVGGSGGLNFGVGARFNDANNTGGNGVAGDMDTILAAKYSGDAFSVGAQITDGDSLADAIFVLGGSYSMGAATIGLTLADNGNDNAYALAVAFEVAEGSTVKLGFDSGDAIAGGNGDTVNLQFDKNLSKTTYVGAQFSDADDQADSHFLAYLGVKF